MSSSLRMVLATEADRDGTVTLAEFLTAVERAFRLVDVDGNDFLSHDEINDYRVGTGQMKPANRPAIDGAPTSCLKRPACR